MLFQQSLFHNPPKPNNTSTFLKNMKLPIHRWFRFSAGFSAQWVNELIDNEIKNKGPDICLLDPFAGSGTTGCACIKEDFNCVLIERDEEYINIINARLNAYQKGDKE